LAQANQIDPVKPFELIKYLSKEFEYLPWNTFIKRLNYYVDMIESTEIYGDFNNYLIEIVKPVYDDLKWESDMNNDSWLKRY
jgi:hypothetical protein